MQLEIEREALQKETGPGLKGTASETRKELAELRRQAIDALKAQWQAEKQAVQRLRALREQIEQTKIEIEQAERQYDLNRAAELQYGKLADLERRLQMRRRAAGQKAGAGAAPQRRG